MKIIGVTELRAKNTESLKELREPVIVAEHSGGKCGVMLAVLIPYQLFMEMQTELATAQRKLRGH